MNRNNQKTYVIKNSESQPTYIAEEDKGIEKDAFSNIFSTNMSN